MEYIKKIWQKKNKRNRCISIKKGVNLSVMIFNLKDKPEYIEEVAILTEKEWGKFKNKEEFEIKVKRKMERIKEAINKNIANYCKLILVEQRKINRIYIDFSRRWRRRKRTYSMVCYNVCEERI